MSVVAGAGWACSNVVSGSMGVEVGGVGVVLQVSAVGRDRAGDVVSLCGPGWSSSAEVVIAGIESAAVQYFVVVEGTRAVLRVVPASVYGGKWLRTSADTVRVDLLDRLPAGCVD